MLRANWEEMRGWKLIAISLDFPHHASGSGYGQLARQIEYDSVITPPCGPIAQAYSRLVARTNKVKFISRITRRRVATEAKYLWRHLFHGKKLVHVFYGEHHSWILRYLPSTRKTKKIMTNHLPPGLWYLGYKPGQLNRFDGVILLSESQLAPLREKLGYQGKVCVIPHGINLSAFEVPSAARDLSKIRCVMVGNFLRDYPGLAEVAKQSPEMEFHVVANDEEFAPLVGLANVTHHKKISDKELLALYQRCNVAVFTMRDSTANNAVLEAMATGLPVVGNDIGGISTYVNDSFAFLTKTVEPAEIREQIHRAVEPGGYAERSNAARRQAETFNWSHVAQQTLDFYREVLSEGRK